MQVGSELRLKKTGEIVVDNPEIEVSQELASEAVLSHRFDSTTGEHVLMLLDPLANRQHMDEREEGD